MAIVVFLAVFISLLILLVRLITNVINGRDLAVPLRAILLLVGGYVLLWFVCYGVRQDRLIPLGVDNCFDSWCVSVVGADYPATLGRPDRPVRPKGQFVLLYMKMANRSRRYGQDPVEPRVVVFDDAGRSWETSPEGQAALERSSGAQLPLDEFLRPGKSEETELVFDVAADAKGLKARVDVGKAWSRWLLLPGGKSVYLLP